MTEYGENQNLLAKIVSDAIAKTGLFHSVGIQIAEDSTVYIYAQPKVIYKDMLTEETSRSPDSFMYRTYLPPESALQNHNAMAVAGQHIFQSFLEVYVSNEGRREKAYEHQPDKSA